MTISRYPLILLLLALPAMMFSQQFDAGIKTGISASQISGDQLGGFDKPGIYAGIFTSIELNQKSLITLEMNYVEKGSRKLARPDKGIYNSYRLMLNYIEIPVTYQYFIHDMLSLESGPSFGVLIKRDNNEEDENGVLNGTRPFNKYEFALNGGMNFWFNDNFAIGGRYSVSLLPVRKHDSGSTYWFNRGQHIELLRFYVTYRF